MADFLYTITPALLEHMTYEQLDALYGDLLNEYEWVRDQNEGSRMAAGAAVGHLIKMVEAAMGR